MERKEIEEFAYETLAKTHIGLREMVHVIQYFIDYCKELEIENKELKSQLGIHDTKEVK